MPWVFDTAGFPFALENPPPYDKLRFLPPGKLYVWVPLIPALPEHPCGPQPNPCVPAFVADAPKP